MTLTIPNTLKRKTEILTRRMQDDGIERDCRDWRQYIKAKRLAECLTSSPDEYEFLIKKITNFLNV